MEQQILDLYSQGKSYEEISQALNVPLYKVVIITTRSNG